MLTINDIAKACSTSPSTISKVLNGNDGKISASKRDEILAAVKRLQYRPAAQARGLARRRASMIGVVSVRLPRMFSFQYNMVLIGAMLDEATAHQQTLALFNGQIWADEEREQLIFADGRCDGYIILDANKFPGLIAALQRHSIRFVAVNSGDLPSWVTALDVDDIQVGYRATRHLIERGHRCIAYLEQDAQSSFSRKRLEGYKQALAESGIDFEEKLVVAGDGIANHAHDRVRHLVEHEPGVTALFCAHDAIALSAMQGLKSLGYRIPKDYSVIGVNDIPDAACSVPTLTTVNQDLDGLGVHAVQVLMELIENPDQPARQILWPTQLVERQSVAPPRENSINRVNPNESSWSHDEGTL
jgi:LacI family transcriptional regulator